MIVAFFADFKFVIRFFANGKIWETIRFSQIETHRLLNNIQTFLDSNIGQTNWKNTVSKV